MTVISNGSYLRHFMMERNLLWWGRFICSKDSVRDLSSDCCSTCDSKWASDSKVIISSWRKNITICYFADLYISFLWALWTEWQHRNQGQTRQETSGIEQPHAAVGAHQVWSYSQLSNPLVFSSQTPRYFRLALPREGRHSQRRFYHQAELKTKLKILRPYSRQFC